MMSQRGPPSNPSGTRYIPRDHSPPHFQDGRGSIQHSGPLTARITDPPYGALASRGHSNAGTGVHYREPPKGPRALTDGPPRGGAFVARGRGFGHRVDVRDRDPRDTRDLPPPGRSAGHDWSWQTQLAAREQRLSPKGRDRSRSPQLRGSRDLRPTDLDIERARRNSRDGPPTLGYIGLEGPMSGGYRGRGAFRARGRGDLDGGRQIYQDDQETIRPRSWSRDENWNRNGQIERERERVRDIYRREDDCRKGWDGRDVDKQKREFPPFRPDSRNSIGAQATPSTPQSISTSSSNHNYDHGSYRPRASSIELGRRASNSFVPQSLLPNLRETERRDSNPWRPDPIKDRQLTRQASPPPQAPQVPAFGSIALPPTSTNSKFPNDKSGGLASILHIAAAPRPIAAIAPKPAPVAPKADLASRPPTGPKAQQEASRRPNQELTNTGAYGFDAERGRHGSARNPSLTTGSGYHATSGRDHQPYITQTATQPHTALSNFSNKSETTSIARPSSLVPQQPSHRRTSEAQVSKDYGSSPASALSSRQITSGSSVQPSPNRIPTGPRAARSMSSNRQAIPTPTRPAITKVVPPTYPIKNSLQWINPNAHTRDPPYAPKGPSIMNTLPTKRDYVGDDGARGFRVDQKRHDHEDVSLDRAGDGTKSFLAGHIANDSQDEGEPGQEPTSKAESAAELAPESIVSLSSEAPGVDLATPDEIQKVTRDDHTIPEDEADLDEEDFVEAERKFERQMLSLEARKSGNPRDQAILTSFLEEIDALATAAEESSTAEEVGEQHAHDQRATGEIASGLLSPKIEEQDQIAFPDVPMIEHSTPSIESLPFLVSGPPTPFSELDFWQEQVESHDAAKDRMLETLVKLDDQFLLEQEKLTSQYINFYKPWRLKNEDLDAENHVPVVSISPVPATSPVISMVTPAPITEGRRAGKFQSELDVQRLIAETAQAAQHEQERRDREARALLDTAKEALIPDMLMSVEKSMLLYQDLNQLVDRRQVLEAFGFVPAPDNFSEEEQKVFCEQYAMYPKKWGKLAEALPGRDYQDCIRHYYLSKADGKYKRLPKGGTRKGRKGMRMQGRPKSTAFMSVPGVRANQYDTDETESTVIAMTETGRPRRAAAPTFGDVLIAAELESAPLVQTPGRRNTISARVESPGDTKTNAEKPTGKRGRNPQAKEKGTRKGKAITLLAPAPGPSPLKKENLSVRGKSKEPKPTETLQESKIEDDQHLTNFNQSIVIPTSQIEGWLGDQRNTQIGTVQFPKPQQAGQEQQQQRASGPVSSYWSVNEQQDFVKLLGYFGTDWQAISTQMKTKTHIMVKNYYFRSLEAGKSEFEQVGLDTDARIRKGEDMGPLPAPTPFQKRKYETTPQMVPQRPLAPSMDSIEIEDDSPGIHAATISPTSSPQFGQQPPSFPILSQSGTKSTIFALDLPTSGGIEPNVRPMAPSQQHRTPQPLQGPRAGYFNEERKENRPIPQAHTVQQFPEQAGHQRQLVDMQAQDFQEQLSRQHKVRQQAQEIERAPSRQRKSAQTQQSTVIQQYNSDTRPNINTQVRIAPLHATEVEKRPRANSQQQRQQAEPIPFSRRIDTYVQSPHGSTPLQSPASARPSQSVASPAEGSRPSSVPAAASIQPPPRPAPVPPKRINIMSLMNDESAEPQPHKRLSDTRIAVSTQQIPSPSTLSHVYQQPCVPPPQMQRREMPHDASHHMQQQDLGSSFGPPMQLQQQSSSGTWPSASQRTYFSERTAFQPQLVQSPPIQPNFAPPSSRSTFATLQQRPHAPSPPPLPYPSHSRHPSYTSMAPHPHQQQAQPHGASSLQASPYARIQPQTQQHIQPQPPPQQASQTQHAYMSSHVSSPRDEYLRRQEAILMQEMAIPYEQRNAPNQREALRREMGRPDAMDRQGRFTPTSFGGRQVQGQGRER